MPASSSSSSTEWEKLKNKNGEERGENQKNTEPTAETINAHCCAMPNNASAHEGK